MRRGAPVLSRLRFRLRYEQESQSGVAFSVIALRLGHESTTTTHRYVEADLAMKDKALARLQQPDTKMRRYRPREALMQFLQAL
jgi:hypothetical protein